MEQLSSNIEVILLYFINKKPSYAYEINKIINLQGINKWVRVGVASIYRVLIKLEEKGLVHSQSEKDGKMPERKRYYITDTGRAALVEVAKRLLSNLEWYYLDLNVGFETSGLLNPEEIAECLKKRLVKVKSNISRLYEIYSSVEKTIEKTINKKRIIIQGLIYFRMAEERFLREAIEELSRK